MKYFGIVKFKSLIKKNDKVSVLAKASLRFDQKMRLLFLNEPEFLNNQFLTVYRFNFVHFLILFHQKASVIHASAKEKESNSFNYHWIKGVVSLHLHVS